MRRNHDVINKQARLLIGHPVCIELKNGSFYVGRISSIEKGEIIFSGEKGKGTLRHNSSSRTRKARISGFFPGFSSPFNNEVEFGPTNLTPSGAVVPEGGGTSIFGGFGGFFDFMKKAWPVVNMGVGMVKTIMPLLGGLKG